MLAHHDTAYLFDFDGTVTAVELLPRIAAELGLEREMAALTEATMAGELPFDVSLRQRVELLQDVPVWRVAEIIGSAPIFERLLDWIIERREQCWIVTGNLDCWIDGWMQEHGLSYFSSKATIVDDRVHLDTVLRKESVLEQFRNVRTVMLGDGANDAQILADSDIGIACALVHVPPQVILEVADWVIMDEEALCTTLSRL